MTDNGPTDHDATGNGDPTGTGDPTGNDDPTGNGDPTGSASDPVLGGLLGRLARSMGPGGLELGGENVRFEQAPERGLEVRITLLGDDGEVTSIASMLLPGDKPPAEQPEDVPFVPHAALRVIEDHVRSVTLAMWLLDDAAPDPESALAAVLRHSRERGWQLENPGDRGDGPFRLLREDQVRRIELTTGHTGPVISLSQKRQGP